MLNLNITYRAQIHSLSVKVNPIEYDFLQKKSYLGSVNSIPTTTGYDLFVNSEIGKRNLLEGLKQLHEPTVEKAISDGMINLGKELLEDTNISL